MKILSKLLKRLLQKRILVKKQDMPIMRFVSQELPRNFTELIIISKLISIISMSQMFNRSVTLYWSRSRKNR